MKFDINDYHRNIQNEDLLKDVIKISERTEKNTLTQAEYKKEGGRFSKNTFLRHFGSWNEVLRLCGLEVNQWQLAAAKGNKNYHDIKTEELIADLKNVAIQLNKESMSSKEYEEHGKYSKETYFKRFHTWDHALQAAGLKPFVQVSSQRIDDKELLKEIERVWVNLGRQPTSTDIKKGVSKYSLHAYSEHFGGWRGALEAFVIYTNGDSSDDNNADDDYCNSDLYYSNNEVTYVHKTSRDVNLRLRYKVMKRDNFKCCICGASPATDPKIVLHVDHIFPWSKGGETILGNLQTLCNNCNLGKGNLM